jgi:hypothetical protein
VRDRTPLPSEGMAGKTPPAQATLAVVELLPVTGGARREPFSPDLVAMPMWVGESVPPAIGIQAVDGAGVTSITSHPHTPTAEAGGRITMAGAALVVAERVNDASVVGR